jgi:hypothetical protein
MKNIILGLLAASVLFACKKEEDHHHHDDDTTDTTTPVVTITSPNDSNVYHNGDTVHMTGTVTDNDLHNGVIKIMDDTTAFEYYGYYHYVHETSSAVINFDYIVTGVTQNSAVTLTYTYDDHAANTKVVNRKFIFMP